MPSNSPARDQIDANHLEGTQPPAGLICDLCGDELSEQVTVYAADQDYAEVEDGMVAHRVYCSDCSREEIPLPHRGTHERLFEARVDESNLIRGVVLIDESNPHEGQPWDPPAVWNTIAGVPFELMIQETDRMSWSPIAVYDYCVRIGVELADYVDSDR
jgi:hypothetical protein